MDVRSPTALLHRSIDIQRLNKVKERNCKTSSPTNFIPVLQKQKSRNEIPTEALIVEQKAQTFDVCQLFTIFGESIDNPSPRILGYIDKNGTSDPSSLRQRYPYVDALSQISLWEDISPTDPQEVIFQTPKFNTFISTDISGKRIFITSIKYLKFAGPKILQESMQLSSCDSQPLI
jgi:hypothetical protein